MKMSVKWVELQKKEIGIQGYCIRGNIMGDSNSYFTPESRH